MKEFFLVVAGGLIGLLGGISTTFLSHRLQASHSLRDQLLAAYASWSGHLLVVIENIGSLALFDHVEHLKKTNAQAANIPSSPSGKTREELVLDYRNAVTEFRLSEARLLLLESRDTFSAKVRGLSELSFPNRSDLQDVLSFKQHRQDAVAIFLRQLNCEHPLLKGLKDTK